MPSLSGPSYLPENQIKAAVVFLHGFGADGNDLISLTPFMAQSLPETAFFAPDGPAPCEISPFGRQWFSLEKSDPAYGRRQAATQEKAFEDMYDEACQCAPVIEDYLEALRQTHSLTNANIALVGFSQGTMMALHVGLRQKQAFGALVGFSGALVGARHLSSEITSPTPTLLIHGEQDDMLPVHAVTLAQKALEDQHMAPEVLRVEGIGHTIDVTGAQACVAFLQKNLNEA